MPFAAGAPIVVLADEEGAGISIYTDLHRELSVDN